MTFILLLLWLVLRTTAVASVPVLQQQQQQQLMLSDAAGIRSGCNRTISLLIKPCICKDIIKQRHTPRHSSAGGDGDGERHQYKSAGTWLNCQSQDLDDDRMSRILTIFLSSEMNRNLRQRIYLPFNRLTQIFKEISLFRRLQKVNLYNNRITSIRSAYIDSSSSSASTSRLIRLDFRSNRLSHIEAGAFQGNASL